LSLSSSALENSSQAKINASPDALALMALSFKKFSFKWIFPSFLLNFRATQVTLG
jgi:hypothetical protein